MAPISSIMPAGRICIKRFKQFEEILEDGRRYLMDFIERLLIKEKSKEKAGENLPDFVSYALDWPSPYAGLRRILVDVQGGLGDQIQAEPALRFALKHVWNG